MTWWGTWQFLGELIEAGTPAERWHHSLLSGKPGRKNGESGAFVLQDGSREEGRAHWLYQKHGDKELLDKLNDWVEVRCKQLNMGRTVWMEMVMTARGVFFKAMRGKGKCPGTGSGSWSARYWVRQATPWVGGWAERQAAVFFLLRCHPHPVPSSSKHTFKISYLLTWVAVKQMFTLKLFVEL